MDWNLLLLSDTSIKDVKAGVERMLLLLLLCINKYTNGHGVEWEVGIVVDGQTDRHCELHPGPSRSKVRNRIKYLHTSIRVLPLHPEKVKKTIYYVI